MFRSVMLGILGFVAVFTASRQFAGVGKDIARYDRIRAMSGDPPFLRQQAAMLLGGLKVLADRRPDIVHGIVSMAVNDLTWNARVRSM